MIPSPSLRTAYLKRKAVARMCRSANRVRPRRLPPPTPTQGSSTLAALVDQLRELSPLLLTTLSPQSVTFHCSALQWTGTLSYVSAGTEVCLVVSFLIVRAARASMASSEKARPPVLSAEQAQVSLTSRHDGKR
eukprot:GHVU01231752.1.p1 GENE.GHVU01231752.1~~GHVU01231752.1.p1  ORF type:complete len:134 (+),score=3.11 GHVU01231752.1:280-681(+)